MDTINPKELQKRIKELERQLEDAQLRAQGYVIMIDIAEKQLNIPIRKKSGTKISTMKEMHYCHSLGRLYMLFGVTRQSHYQFNWHVYETAFEDKLVVDQVTSHSGQPPKDRHKKAFCIARTVHAGTWHKDLQRWPAARASDVRYHPSPRLRYVTRKSSECWSKRLTMTTTSESITLARSLTKRSITTHQKTST